MKKYFCILSLLCLICLLAVSCAPIESKQPKLSQETQLSVDTIIEKNIKQYENSEQSSNTPSSPQIVENEAELIESTPQIADETSQSETGQPDVDLTVLSSTMVYAEVYNMMIDADSYVGKTIKGSGIYNSFYYEELDRYFHYFIIMDATGCCPQGLDFVWNGEHIYPDDYPEIGEDIEVTGIFIKGEVEGQSYYYLAVDEISVLK